MKIHTIAMVFLYFVAILVISMLLFWVLGSDEGQPNARPSAPGPSGPGAGRMVESLGEPPEPQTGDRPENASADHTGSVPPENGKIFAREITGPTLTVVDGQTGRPIPEARLMMLDTQDLPWLQVRTENPDALLATHGLRRTCDPDGRVTLPWPSGEWLIEARHQRLWNRRIFSADTATALTLSLFPVHAPPSLQVQVVDEKRQPRPGVDVVLYDRKTGAVRHTARSRTPDGMAVFRLPRADVDELLAHDGVDVALDIPGRPEVQTTLTGWPDQPVQLVLPETGQLTLLLQGPDQQPWTGPAHVRLRFEDRAGWIERFRPVREGRVCWPFVRPGGQYHIQVFLHEQIPVGPEHHVSGPPSAGKNALHTLVLGRDEIVLTGLAFSPDGKLLRAPATLELQLAHDLDGMRFLSRPVLVHPDEQGRFALPVLDWPYRELRVRWIHGGRVRAAGVAPLHGPYPQGIHRLLGVRLEATPLLVAGVVQDQCGNPLPLVNVELHLGGFRGGALPENATPDHAVITNPAGRFAFWWMPVHDSLALVASTQAHGQTTPRVVKKNVKPGTCDVVLVLHCAGSLAGSVVLPDHADGLLLEAVALTPDGTPAGPARLVAADGTFRLESIHHDPVQVMIRRAGESRPLATVENIPVRPGAIRRDPRLAGIDLGDKLRILQLLVTGSGDRPLAGAMVQEVDAPNSCTLTDDRGRCRLMVDRPAVDLVVRAPGHRMKLVRAVSKDRTIQLGPGLPVQLGFDPPLALPPGVPDLVVVSLRDPANRTRTECRPSPVCCSLPLRPGPIFLQLETPGDYAITVCLGSETIQLQGAVTVADRTELQRFTVSLPADRVAAALESAVKIEK